MNQHLLPVRGVASRAIFMAMLLTGAASFAQTAAPAGDPRAAAIDVKNPAGLGRTFPIDPPLVAPLKETNYPVPAGAFFVAPDGIADTPGTRADAPTTVDKAIERAPDGSTIVFRGGTYRGVNNTVKKKLTFQPYSREKAWLKGSVIVTDWVRDGALWRKNNWTKHFSPNPKAGPEFVDKRYPMGAHRDMVWVNGRAQFAVATREQVSPGRFWVDYANHQIFLGDDPTGKQVEVTNERRSLGAYAAGTIIRGLGFTHYADIGVLISAPNCVLENNTCVWNTMDGAHVSNNKGGVIRYAVGIWLDIDCDNAVLVHNRARHNNVIGLFFEISRGAIIAFNVCHDNSTGIQVSNSSDTRVVNNTLVNNTRGFLLKHTKRRTENENDGDALYVTANNVCKNNLFVNTKPNPDGAFVDVSQAAGDPSREKLAAADHNAYYRAVPSDLPGLIRWSFGGERIQVFATLAEFRTATGHEKNAHVIDGMSVQPLFVNEAGGDFRLRSGSPAIDRGEALPSDIARAAGRPAAPVSIGAQEKAVRSTGDAAGKGNKRD